jgi:hypothetical protein
MKPDYCYTVLPDGRVRLVNNYNGQVLTITRAQVVRTLAMSDLAPDLKKKYVGALAALDRADRESQRVTP